MPLEENIATYKYFLEEADKLGLSCITLVRYSPMFDVKYDGKSTFLKLECLFILCNQV